MEKLLGKKTKRTNKGFFPEKLFNILNNKKNKAIIHWDKEGKIVVIENKAKFSKEILQKKFLHNNYDSFIRQLNLYGFEKLPNIETSEKDKFFLENFSKNLAIDDIKKIKRKIKVIEHINLPKEKEEKEETKQINENDKKIEEFLFEINKEKNDYALIEKYKSIINDDKIIINNKLLTNILNYVSEKKEEIKNNIENNIKEISKLKTLYEREKFKFIKNNFEELDIDTIKKHSDTSIKSKNKKIDFQKPVNPIDLRKSFNGINENNFMNINIDKFKEIPLKGSYFSINSNDSDITFYKNNLFLNDKIL